jgi:hypothetical protein
VAPFLDLEPFAAPWLTLEAELVLQLLRISMREPFGGADGAVVAGNRTEGTEGTNGSVPGGTPATTGRRPAPPEK